LTHAAGSVAAAEEPVTLSVESGERVSALLTRPPATPSACYVLAHGAGAGMRHPFMSACAGELAQHGIATLRFQFPYMERGSRRTDPPPLCHATVRAAVTAAARYLPGTILIAGGRSFGGRMSSQAQAQAPLPQVRALAFLGFPLHPAGKPGDARAEHLARVSIPMRFIQGTRDELAERALLEPVLARLGPQASVDWIEDADHSFHVRSRAGRSDAQARADFIARLAQWMTQHA
jgi:uncharacterized protein